MKAAAPGITEDEALALFNAVCGKETGPHGRAKILGRKQGTFNQIFHIEAGDKQFALRVRHNESGFQYERGVFKEVLAALLLSTQGLEHYTGAELALANIWDRITGRRSTEWIRFPWGAGIVHFDFTGAQHPGPWAVLEWTGNALGPAFDAVHAFELGQLVAQIHRTKFKNAYSNLHRLHFGGVDILSEWKDEIARRNRNLDQIVAPAEDLQDRLELLHAGCPEAGTEFVLCHNDLHCLNVTGDRGSLRLVDWDNAQIAPKELDFVKLAHWSRLGPDGHFEPAPDLFASFCGGYGADAKAVLSSPVFKLAELLWLFRVLEFASAKEEPARPPFWPPGRYAGLLRERLAAPSLV
jgi:Ser/Thr protein kinase RdoA (MazF antagonist)